MDIAQMNTLMTPYKDLLTDKQNKQMIEFKYGKKARKVDKNILREIR